MSYTHLSLEERYQIYALLQANRSYQHIAKCLARAVSTISREVQRNRGRRGYRAKQAHRLAQERMSNNAKTLPSTTWKAVIKLLKKKWRPEQIAGHLKLLSHMSIYRFLHCDKRNGGVLYQYLRHRLKPYRKRSLSDGRGQIKGRTSIHDRPAIVETRRRIGDWEADTVIGKNHQQALVTLVERKTGLVKIRKVSRRTARKVAMVMQRLLKPLLADVKTITSDNGKEFAQHATVAQALSADFYFADPYASWQRGSNENTNGLIREYLPKGSDFTLVSHQQIQGIEDALNNRPRKRLNFKSPNQVFFNN